MKHRKMSISSLHPTTTPNYRKKTRGEKGSKFVSIDDNQIIPVSEKIFHREQMQ